MRAEQRIRAESESRGEQKIRAEQRMRAQSESRPEDESRSEQERVVRESGDSWEGLEINCCLKSIRHYRNRYLYLPPM